MIRIAVGAVVALVTLVLSAGAANAQPGIDAMPGECEQAVRFGLVDARAACLRTAGTPDRPRWESQGEVTVNGIRIPVPAGRTLVLNGPSEADPGGSLSLSLVKLTVGGVTLYDGGLRWDFPRGGGPGEEGVVAEVDLSRAGERLVGMPVRGTTSIRMGRRADGSGYTTLGMTVALPEVFRSGTGSDAGGVTGSVAVLADAAGVHLDGLRVEVRNAYIGKLAVKGVCLSFVAAGGRAVVPCEQPSVGGRRSEPFLQCQQGRDANRWDGSAVIVLPTESRTELGVFAGLRDGQLSYAGGFVENLGDSVPLAPGVYLDRVALAVCLVPPPLQLKGEAAVRIGPTVGGRQLAQVTGTFLYRDPHGPTPWFVETRGRLDLAGFQMADAFVKYQGSGAVDFGFGARFQWGPASLEGRVAGWLETTGARRFNVEGNVEACLWAGCARGEGVVSSVGAAGCVSIYLFSYPVLVRNHDWAWWAWWRVHWEWRHVNLWGGAGYAWASGSLNLMAGSCSIDGWRARRSVTAARSRSTQTVTIADGQPGVALRVRGVGAPPRVAFVGPDGRRIAPQLDGERGAIEKGEFMFAENPQDSSTNVLIAGPEAGRWKIVPLPGSAPIAGIDTAGTVPPPTITAGVGGRGRKRVLTYAFVPTEGQRIVFVERGPDTNRTLGIARAGECPGRIDDRRGPKGLAAACGRLRFEPGAGRAGRREIVALVHHDGLPRETVTIASYRAPADRRPARPRGVLVQRVRGGLRVTWRRAPGAVRVNVVARVADGRRLLHHRPARVGRLRVPHIALRRGVRIAIRGMRLDGVEGRPVHLRLRPGQGAARRAGT